MLMSELLSDFPRAARRRRLFWTRARFDRAVDRAIRATPWILGALFGAAALHLLMIFALPTLWPTRPTARWRPDCRLAKPRSCLVPNPAAAAPPFPTLSRPWLCAGSICPPARRRILAEADSAHPFSISVRLTDGTIIYSGNDRDTPSGRFNIRIVTQKQADAEDASQGAGNDAGQDAEPSDSPDMAANDELRLTSPNLRGFVVFCALASREGDYDAARSALETAGCAVEKASP